MKSALKTTAFILLLALTAPVWIVAIVIWAGVDNHDRYYDIDLEDNMAKLARPRGKYDSCMFCVHRSECWNGDAYSDAGGGKKPYPSTVKCTTRFKLDKRFNAYS